MSGDTWQAMCHKVSIGTCMCDTWQAMCPHAWSMELLLKGVHNQFIEEWSNKEERKREKKEKKKRKRKRKREREKERKRKEVGGFFLSSLAFQQSELVRPRSKVLRFDEGLLWFISSLWAIILG